MMFPIYALVELYNKAFSEKLWMQASRLQNSRVLNFLSQGTAAAREMNYHKACLTKFHNSYRSLVNLENSNISDIDFSSISGKLFRFFCPREDSELTRSN